MPLSDVQHILSAGPARRRSAGKDVWLLDTGPWWRLFRDYQGLSRTKESLLQAAWRLPFPLFLVLEEPVSEDLVPFLHREASAWRVDKSRSPKDFYSTEPASGLGNWLLYAAAQPLDAPPPDTFRAPPEAVLSFMAAHGVVLLIAVFHDDTDWCIAVCDHAPSPAAA